MDRMHGLKRLVSIVMIVAALVAIWTLLHRGTEPTYEGRTLSQWVSQIHTPTWADEEDAIAALRFFGDRAAPPLLALALDRYEATAPRRAYMRVRSIFPQAVRALLPDLEKRGAETARKAMAALEVLHAIKPSATVIMPTINRLAASGDWGSGVLGLSGCIGVGGSNAVPLLVRALESTNNKVKAIAVQELRYLGPDARAAVPALVPLLQHPAIRWRVLQTLISVGPAAQEAAPSLRPFLQSTNTLDRLAAAAALHRIDPASGTLDILLAAVKQDADLDRRMSAALLLGEMGSDAAATVPALLDALLAEARPPLDTHKIASLLGVLDRISPTNQDVVSILVNALDGTRGFDHVTLASWLLSRGERRGFDELISIAIADHHEGVRLQAIWALRWGGRKVREAALPTFQAALKDPDPAVQKEAEAAVARTRLDRRR